MKDCLVTIEPSLTCKGIGEKCLFLANENINEGVLSGLKYDLKEQYSEYLQMLADDEVGTGYRKCVKHNLIARLAREILEGK